MDIMHRNTLIKLFMILLISLASLLFHELQVSAENKAEPEVLVVFSSKDEEINEHQRLLDMLIGHFTTNITFKNTSEVQSEDLRDVTHLFYYGQRKENLPESFQHITESYSGPFVALGYNTEQLGERFSFVEIQSEEVFTKMTLVGDEDKSVRVFPHSLINSNTSDDTEVLVKATHGKENEYPLLVKKVDTYYFASPILQPPLSIFLGEVLHEVFDEEHDNIHPGYIRLEDVHPLVEPKKLMEIAEVLKERDIPYMIAVIPVYTNQETNEQYHLSDYPNLIKALKYMQDNGGSVVLHGYTHQFRSSETGEGFEFWDVMNNMPIYHGPDEKVTKKTEADFDSPQAYENYTNENKAFEKNYINKKITRGIQELANYGLYPLAFEAPHYTMSQNGYAVTSEHFSTYVGQVQTSDEDWEIMTTAPYVTKPTFFNGMELLPETIGYVQPNDPNAIEKMLNKAKEYSIVRDGMVAGFYHPYLGVEGFIELLDELEKIPNVKWIDLKQVSNTVTSENVEIITEDGEVVPVIDQGSLFSVSWDFPLFHIKELVVKATWGMVGAGALAVIFFTIYILTSRKRYRRGRIG